MFQKHWITVLLTANVFQNGLSRHEESWRYFTDLLRRLPSLPVNWYISALDYDLAFTLRDVYGLGGDQACQAAYAEMRSIIKVCPVNEWILEDSGSYRINFFDAIRLACAVDRNMDAIVTWEPHLFASTDRERSDVQKNNFFYLNQRTWMGDDQSIASQTIGVFSVSAFLLHLDKLSNAQAREEIRCSFNLEELSIEINSDIQAATVIVRNPQGEYIRETAIASTPCDALYKAINQCVDQCLLLPDRYLILFTVPGTIGGADAPVEVRISVECDRRLFEASATNTNVLWAFGDAYMAAINQICNTLSFG